MAGRLVIVAVVLLAAVAAADGVRSAAPGGGEPIRVEARRIAAIPLAANETRGFRAVADGGLTRTRVERGGGEVLSAAEIDGAFPIPLEAGGTFDVAHLAVAPDGTLAVALHKFPGVGSARAGIELWRGGRLLGSFEVPPGSFAGGIGFTADGRLVAAFERGRHELTLFDRSGRWQAYVPLG